MICKFCGNVIEDNSDFCFICGQKVAVEVTAPAAEVEEAVAPAAAPVYYAQPAAPAPAPAPAAVEPFDKKAQKKAAKAAKKAAKGEKGIATEVSKGKKIISGLIPAVILAVAGFKWTGAVIAIVLVLTALYAFYQYNNYKKTVAAGYEDNANAVANSALIGACVGMAIIAIMLIKNYMLS